ncbi:hypothetical protein [Porticoccus sp.]|uniref:hypothetical protein n=1 Tax=Porticoccus sp. TaxID=2024853 RepID=UPI000C664E7D|nr:hypothetical protein [Porticoccus sp.]MAZ70058.1 hypothetical protein [Porticoccus sp.]|tara:strand:+ start:31060 stop:31713 length:654 start_codon:yes stop_codon:yes gene_type:complete
MDTVIIRQAIAAAKTHERTTGQLARLLKTRVSPLHKSIQLPSENIIPALLNFIIHYIDKVPEFIDAVDAIADECGLIDYIEPVISTAREFFMEPPALVAGHEGLNSLMGESYLAHRLVEEVNDRFISGYNMPLVPMDMTRSNLIIHHLIGEPFANQLDSAVHLIVDELQQKDLVFVPEACREDRSNRWASDLQRWPCLIDNLSVNLLFNGSGQLLIH